MTKKATPSKVTPAPVAEQPEDLSLEEQSSQVELDLKSAGQILREAREAQKMDLSVLASVMKVSVDQIKHLEADQYDQLPDIAFTRNFAIAIAKRLNIDDKEVLKLLPKIDNQNSVEAVVKFSQDAYGSAVKGGGMGRKRRSHIWWIALVILLVTLALLYKLLPPLSSERAPDAGQEVPLILNDGGASISLDITPSIEQGIGSVVPQDAAVVVADSNANVVAVESANLLEITTTTQSWLRVRNGKGVTLIDRMLNTGETYTLAKEELPLSIRIGNAAQTMIKVRGKVFDATSNTSEGVANFNVQ